MGEESVDLSGAIDMLKDMMSGEEGQQQIQNIMNMFIGKQSEAEDNEQNVFGEIDGDSIAMMMKLQKAMSVMNSKENSSQVQLLSALRPFLKPSRREKVDNAMKLLNLSKVMEVMQEVQGE